MTDKQYDYLIELLKNTQDNADIPVSAIVIDKDDNIVGYGTNTRQKTMEINGHAEINAINMSIKKTNNINLSDCKLITLLEPCLMCYSAAYQSKIKEIDYILENNKNDLTRNISINHNALVLKKIGSFKQEEKYAKILNDFFEKNIRN